MMVILTTLLDFKFITITLIGLAIVAGIALTFLLCKSIRALRWLFMLVGGGAFLFFSILAMIQFVNYNEAWKADFIDSGYTVWSDHWDFTIYKNYFNVALYASSIMVFLYIFGDKAYEINYIEVWQEFEVKNAYSWFKPTIIEEVYKTKVHRYFFWILLFGVAAGGSLVIIPQTLCLFCSNYDYYFVFYTIEIVLSSITFITLIFLFIRAIRYTRDGDD